MYLKKVSKKIVLITGKKGVLGSYFHKKYKKKYRIIHLPYRLEKFDKIEKWIKNKNFHFFIHFAAITSKTNKNFNKINLINKEVPINLINLFQKKFIKNFKYFLFISSSHVYGFHKKKILESDKRKPFNKYGNSKKNVEDFIIKNKKKFYFKIGIARIFNFTSNKQNYGHFVPDMYSKIKNRFKNFRNIQQIAKFAQVLRVDVSPCLK